MKKVFLSLFCFFVCLSCIFAETWHLTHAIDKFGDPTDEECYYADKLSGTYSGVNKKDGSLRWQIECYSVRRIQIRLDSGASFPEVLGKYKVDLKNVETGEIIGLYGERVSDDCILLEEKAVKYNYYDNTKYDVYGEVSLSGIIGSRYKVLISDPYTDAKFNLGTLDLTSTELYRMYWKKSYEMYESLKKLQERSQYKEFFNVLSKVDNSLQVDIGLKKLLTELINSCVESSKDICEKEMEKGNYQEALDFLSIIVGVLPSMGEVKPLKQECEEKIALGLNSKCISEHEFDEGEVLEEATCTKGGRKKYTCVRCGWEKTEDTSLIEHDYDSYTYQCKVCGYGTRVGEKGEAGGTVIYDKGNSDDGWRFIEVAPEDVPGEYPMGQVNKALLKKLKSGIGDGKANTELLPKKGKMIEGNPSNIFRGYDLCLGVKTAAQAALDYNYNGFDDWFLPTYAEISRYTYLRDSIFKYWVSDALNFSSDARLRYYVAEMLGGMIFGAVYDRLGRGDSSLYLAIPLSVRCVRTF